MWRPPVGNTSWLDEGHSKEDSIMVGKLGRGSVPARAMAGLTSYRLLELGSVKDHYLAGIVADSV